jgi:hypothetical protein
LQIYITNLIHKDLLQNANATTLLPDQDFRTGAVQLPVNPTDRPH